MNIFYVKSYLLIAILFSFSSFVFCGKGCIPLDTFSFDKLTSKFEVSLIKFDAYYPYGAKHDAFEVVCESSSNAPDLLIGEVQIQDYGERINQELGERFGVEKDDLPVVKLFKNGKFHSTFEYKDDKDFTADALKLFIRKNTGVYLGLPGCLEKFDKIVEKFTVSKTDAERKALLKDAESLWDKVSGKRDYKSAGTYVKLMRKVLENGQSFVEKERLRAENLLNEKVSKDKKSEIQERINILKSFSSRDEL